MEEFLHSKIVSNNNEFRNFKSNLDSRIDKLTHMVSQLILLTSKICEIFAPNCSDLSQKLSHSINNLSFDIPPDNSSSPISLQNEIINLNFPKNVYEKEDLESKEIETSETNTNRTNDTNYNSPHTTPPLKEIYQIKTRSSTNKNSKPINKNSKPKPKSK